MYSGNIFSNRSKQPSAQLNLGDDEKLDKKIANIEKATIEKALNHNRWNRTKAANELGLTLRQLRYKMSKLGLDLGKKP